MTDVRITNSADAIVKYRGGIVLIERLARLPGIAFPGGKQEPGELLSGTILREIPEEVGLSFTIESVLGVYADPARDPRGHYVSVVFIGTGTGTLRAEPGKTRPFIVSEHDLPGYADRMILDHGSMARDYLSFK